MLEYRKLGSERNAIRLITILGLRDQGLFRDKLIECSLDHVSLDDYTPEYVKFLETDGLDRSRISRAILWDYISRSKDVRIQLEQAIGAVEGITPRLIRSVADNPMYQDHQKYNENMTRWNWGEFDALSYQWGDPTDTREIIVNKQRVKVTKNLEEALRNLRLRTSKRRDQNRIWVDALCINQDDTAERNLQVKRMKSIYAEAETVYAWAGPKLKHGGKVAKFITAASNARLSSPEAYNGFLEAMLSRYDSSTWEGIIELVSRPYWNRLWIIQELLLASTAIELCFGDQRYLLSAWFVAFDALRSILPAFMIKTSRELFFAFRHAKIFRPKSPFTISLRHTERLFVLDRFKYQDLPQPNLMQLLDTGRNAQQKDIRDKVYALLGLMDTEIQNLVSPNYDAPVFEIYMDFSRSVIKATSKLEIIFQGASSPIRNEHLPSWVPDWSIATGDDGTLFNLTNELRAAGDTKHIYESGNDEAHLICRGFRVDAIDGLGCDSVFEPHVTHHVVPSSIKDSSPNVYKDNEGVQNALWETLTIEQINEFPSSVSTLCRALPWFNGAAIAKNHTYYSRIDLFQQCNQNLEIAGKALWRYFPQWSEEFDVPPADPALHWALDRLIMNMMYKRLMTTKKGYVGYAPKKSQQNDFIFVLMGCGLPLVLRPCENGLYSLVGECYIHGIMKGEAMEWLDRGECKLETVTLC